MEVRGREILSILPLLFEDSSSDEEKIEDFDILAVCQVFNKGMPRHRQENYTGNIVTNFRIDEFKTFFRMDKCTFEYLVEWVVKAATEKNVESILCRKGSGGMEQKSLPDRILAMLWFMASLDKYASIGDRFGMSESTACTAIHRLLSLISEHLLDRFIVWPTHDEQQEMQQMFFESKKFPGVIGMVDGTHIKIHQPTERGTDYYNRKDFFSMVLQVVCREDLRFTHVYTGWPGKVHDARVFRHSGLLEDGARLCGNSHVLGDSAYPNLPFLLTPFRDNGSLTSVQKKFNKVHASIRVHVERAIGLMKGRFVRLQNLNQRSSASLVSTILAGCVLHNICILNSEEVGDIMEDESVPSPSPNAEEYEEGAQDLGAVKRLSIARSL